MGRTSAISLLVISAVLVMGLAFLSSGPTAWATPNQSPAAQTVPTPGPTAIPITPIPVTLAPTPAPAPGGGVGTITYATGGSVTTPDGITTMTVPPGAVLQTSVDMTLTPKLPAQVPPPPSGHTVLAAIEIQVYVSGTLQPGYQLNQAATVCSKITQADLNAVNNDFAKFVIMRYDSNLNAWVPLTTVVDPVAKTACATVRSFSSFALAVKAVITPGDFYLSGSPGWWLGLGILGLFLVLVGGFALRRTGAKRTS